jgi:hypothetical protein
MQSVRDYWERYTTWQKMWPCRQQQMQSGRKSWPIWQRNPTQRSLNNTRWRICDRFSDSAEGMLKNVTIDEQSYIRNATEIVSRTLAKSERGKR